jgi:hypothetical protein
VVLSELGITEPSEIDIDAIAQHCGATILYEPLHGSAARIIGAGNKALITVESSARRGRQRFSAAHELGHWMRDRGKVAFSCTTNQLLREWSEDNPERRANSYGADLLMPSAMFKKWAERVDGTLDSVRALASTFNTSLTATAIKFVRIGILPSMLICNEPTGRRWFFRSPLVPEELWPVRSPGLTTVAAKIFAGRCSTKPDPETVDADEWIEHRDASRYCVLEHSVGIQRDLVLTLLWWHDEEQILALDPDEEELPAELDVPRFGRRVRRR